MSSQTINVAGDDQRIVTLEVPRMSANDIHRIAGVDILYVSAEGITLEPAYTDINGKKFGNTSYNVSTTSK